MSTKNRVYLQGAGWLGATHLEARAPNVVAQLLQALRPQLGVLVGQAGHQVGEQLGGRVQPADQAHYGTAIVADLILKKFII